MSVRIDFYILPDRDTEARQRFACRLAHKALTHGHQVHVHTPDLAMAEELDALMWRYPPLQFLPHARPHANESAGLAPVMISHETPGETQAAMLINLSHQVPAFFGQFERVAEIVIASEKATMRENYRFYRNKGYALYHHELEQWED
jgi:DNA polymerase III subunit chi